MRAERIERTYKLEPLDTSGVFLGLGVVQCGLLGAGIVLGVGALTIGAPLPVAAVPASADRVANGRPASPRAGAATPSWRDHRCG